MGYWNWDPNTRRYRVTTEGAAALGQSPGSFVGQKKMLEFREIIITASKERINGLSSQVAKGDINLNQWVLSMREEIKNNFINQYALAHGGRNSMTQSDWGRIGQMVRTQYQYLDRFAGDVATGRYTEVALAARARMYAESSSQAFERAKVAQRGVPDLPAYPGDGSTQCISNCKCSWEISETDTEWRCYWRLSASESCGTCLTRAAQWGPLVIQKT